MKLQNTPASEIQDAFGKLLSFSGKIALAPGERQREHFFS